jgi:hypothetical protein
MGREYGRGMWRTRWSDERIDDSMGRIDARFDRVEGELKELRQLVYYLWGSMLVGFMVVIATVLLGGR